MRTIVPALAGLCALLAATGCARAQDAGGDGTLPGAPFQRRLAGPGAGTTCTATNALHTQQCTTSCPARESADCEDAEGGGVPTCQCTTE